MNRRRADARLATGLLNDVGRTRRGANDPHLPLRRDVRSRVERVADNLAVALVVAGLAVSLLIALAAVCFIAAGMYEWAAAQ